MDAPRRASWRVSRRAALRLGAGISVAALLGLRAAPARANVETVRLVEMVNATRASFRLPMLAVEPRLTTAAQSHADDLAWRISLAMIEASPQGSHRGSDGALPADRVRRAGYRYRVVAENVGAGRAAPEFTVSDWMRSEGHRANLLNRQVRDVGAGYAFNPYDSEFRYYWVLVLAAR